MDQQLAKREVTGEVERKPLERDVWKPEEESISTSQCVSWCQVQPRGHMKGCVMLEEVMLDLTLDASVAMTRACSVGRGGREARLE